MDGGLTRRRLLAAASFAVGALVAAPRGLARTGRALGVERLAVRNLGRPFAGDRTMFATVAPGVSGRDTAALSFALDRPTDVRVEAVRTALRRSVVHWSDEQRLPAGTHEVTWTPDPSTPVGSYVMRVTLSAGERRKVLGGTRPATPAAARAPVVRVLGVEAAFLRRSYLPQEAMELRILADAATLQLTFLRIGHGPDPTLRADELTGEEMAPSVTLDWVGKRSAPRTVRVASGDWPTGLYAARLETEDGRLGFAPFVLRPRVPGGQRVVVVLPTNTWQAYNFADPDGDGWGDTWYAGGNPPVLLDRPYRERGVPPRFRRYDVPFLRWLAKTGLEADIVADDDLEAVASGDDLRGRYDLLVFPGHTEYTTQRAYDVVTRFRELGGSMIFLSANNFFWKVEKQGQEMRRIDLWRKLGRPESRIAGVQYRANDDGSHQGVFYVTDEAAAPWLFEGTGLANGQTFGDEVGGFGIEIDMTTADSPPGTRVVAVIPSLFGPGMNAEMAYHEAPSGARVFSAGVLDFPAYVGTPRGHQLLLNLWQHMLGR